ncbi:MAG: hypothetical protein ACKVYV_04095 [Limisphaerales bacterium]
MVPHALGDDGRPLSSRGRLAGVWSYFAALTLLTGCSVGPKALERTHSQYNEAVIRVTEEQLLLNIVRLRYADNPGRLDVTAIASQYEVGGSLEARPFFSTEGVNLAPPVGPFGEFTRILPFAGVTGTNRPTLSLVPLDDPENVRSLFQPSALDGIIFVTVHH